MDIQLSAFRLETMELTPTVIENERMREKERERVVSFMLKKKGGRGQRIWSDESRDLLPVDEIQRAMCKCVCAKATGRRVSAVYRLGR